MPKDQQQPKIGAGTVDAMLRQGLAEARNALYPDSNIAQPPQLGMFGTSTPREVYETRNGDSLEHEEAPHSMIAGRLQEVERRLEHREPESPEPEKE